MNQPVRSSNFRLMREYQDKNNWTVVEAHKYVRAEMDSDNEEILARYQELVDERMQAVAEVIFENSDLKMGACYKIVQALVNTGYLSS